MRRVLLVLGLVGCNATQVTTVVSEHAAEATVTKCYGEWPKVDALLIVDGSPSMAETAETTSRNGRIIGEAYSHPNVTVDFRIAVIDAQVAQPGCDVDPDHAGSFVDTSCRERLEDFITEAGIEGPGADVRAEGCTDVCELATLNTLPSAATDDSELQPRPWIASTRHVTNLPAGTEVTDDLACRFPTGVAGCEFEAPLEAMRAAIERTQDPSDPAYGFIRPDAVLFVMFVTDEVDCSLRTEMDSLAEAFGTETPTSAACWREGVSCEGDSPYSNCASKDSSALRPQDDYAELLRQINEDKLRRMPGRQNAVVVSVVGGVDWQDTHYADVMDTEWMEAFGIGPGCESEHARAVPPVRLRELSEEFGEQAQWGESSTFSMCGYDWSPAIACLPGPDVDVDPCVELCLADVDPRTPEIEFDCRVEWTDPNGHTLVLPRCNSERPWIPDDAEACGQVLPPGENLCPDPAMPDFVAGFRERRGGCLSFTCQTAPQEVCDQRPLELYVASD